DAPQHAATDLRLEARSVRPAEAPEGHDPAVEGGRHGRPVGRLTSNNLSDSTERDARVTRRSPRSFTPGGPFARWCEPCKRLSAGLLGFTQKLYKIECEGLGARRRRRPGRARGGLRSLCGSYAGGRHLRAGLLDDGAETGARWE